MRVLGISLLTVVLVAATAAALDLTDRYPDKSPLDRPAAAAGQLRVGGDTVLDAFPITELPFSDSGNTCGYADDYDARCYTPSTSADVVYEFAPAADVLVDIDLCGSRYDTKVFLLDAALEAVACSDDYYVDLGDLCGQWNAKLEFVPLMAGETYYIVVDGWFGDCGQYDLLVAEATPCPVECPPTGILEGEPPMDDGYVDLYNGGCFSDWELPLNYTTLVEGQGQNQATVCGVNGFWNDHPEFPDQPYWDDDWYVVHAVGGVGPVEVDVEVERSTYVHELRMVDGDCDRVYYVQSILVRPCETKTVTALGDPQGPLFFWIASMYQTYPDNAFAYVLHFSGIEDAAVPVETVTFSGIKGLFR